MKKLNQTEMKVLAERIWKDLKKQADIAQEKLDKANDEKNRPTAQAIVDEIKSLSKTTRDALRINLKDIKVERFLEKMRTQQTEIELPHRYYGGPSEIIDELVLGQITSPDLDSLCNLVAGKFKK